MPSMYPMSMRTGLDRILLRDKVLVLLVAMHLIVAPLEESKLWQFYNVPLPNEFIAQILTLIEMRFDCSRDLV